MADYKPTVQRVSVRVGRIKGHKGCQLMGWRLFDLEVVRVPNEQNLKPVRTKSEARKRGKAGGEKSGAARRQRKTLKENMNLLLGMDVSNTKDFNKLTGMGIPLEDIDNSMLLTAALFQKAKSGDVAAYKEIRDLMGEEGMGNTGVQIIDDY